MASLGIYGNNQISPFTGLLDIKLNVLDLSHGDIPVSANIQYFGGGVKPESHPSWVGQNWTLNTGGVVTRKTNDDPDEVLTTFNTPENVFSYMDNYNKLNDANWYSNAFIINYYFQNLLPTTTLAPDEFSFTLANGPSGSFYLNHHGVWTVKSSYPGKLKVEVEVNPAPFRLQHPNNSNFYSDIKRIIYKIVITDDKGFRYTFGNDSNSIEFTRGKNDTNRPNNEHIVANAWYLTTIESPKSRVVNFLYERKEPQLHQSVTYYDANLAFTSYAYNKYGVSGSYGFTNPVNYGSQVINPCYLKEINSETFIVKFNTSVSTELKCIFNGSAFTNYANGDLGQTFSSSTPSEYYKIDNIEVFNKTIRGGSTLLSKYYFTYNNVATERLFLKSFYYQMGTGEKKEYKFEYNETTLPPYNARMCDQWGFYNGISYPTNQRLTSSQFLSYLKPDTNLMKAGSLTKIIYPTGGYTSINYESNDFSKKIVKNGNSINLIDFVGLGGGIRVRKISDYDNSGKLTSKEYFYKNNNTGLSSGILGTHRNITTNITMSDPAVVTGNIITNSSFLDLDYTQGREVVYSEVKEVLADGSYTVYNYSNSDNPNYIDELPVNIYTTAVLKKSNGIKGNVYSLTSSNTHPELSVISREMERGNLLSKKIYTPSGKLVYQLKNKYRDDFERFNEGVRIFKNYMSNLYIPLDGGYLDGFELYYQAVKIYTYFPYLKEQIEINYSSINNDSTSTVKKYQYDHNYRLIKEESTIGSNNDVIKTTFKYPFNLIPSADGVHESMVNKNMFSYLIEKKSLRNDVQTELTKTKYYSPSNGLYVPKLMLKQTKVDVPLDTTVIYHTYDSYGNLLSESQLGGVKTSYKWNYYKTLPLVKVNNAASNEFFYEGFEYGIGDRGSSGTSTYTVNWTKPNNKEYVISYWYWTNAGNWKYKAEQPYVGNQFTLLGGESYDEIRIHPKDANMTSYTYRPLFGNISSITSPNGSSTFYFYDESHRLKLIKNTKGEILESYNYHYKSQ